MAEENFLVQIQIIRVLSLVILASHISVVMCSWSDFIPVFHFLAVSDSDHRSLGNMSFFMCFSTLVSALLSNCLVEFSFSCFQATGWQFSVSQFRFRFRFSSGSDHGGHG